MTPEIDIDRSLSYLATTTDLSAHELVESLCGLTRECKPLDLAAVRNVLEENKKIGTAELGEISRRFFESAARYIFPGLEAQQQPFAKTFLDVALMAKSFEQGHREMELDDVTMSVGMPLDLMDALDTARVNLSLEIYAIERGINDKSVTEDLVLRALKHTLSTEALAQVLAERRDGASTYELQTNWVGRTYDLMYDFTITTDAGRIEMLNARHPETDVDSLVRGFVRGTCSKDEVVAALGDETLYSTIISRT